MIEGKGQVQLLRRRLLERMEQEEELTDERIFELIDELILQEGKRTYVSLPQKRQMRTELFNSIRRLDILQELLDDDEVTEIMVNGTAGSLRKNRGGS